jgi:outer membrane protein
MKNIVIAFIAIITLSACTQQKIGYVDSSDLVQDYKAVKTLETELGEKNAIFQAKYQQIAGDFEKEVQEFQVNAKKYSRKKGQAKYEALMMKQQQIQQTQQAENTQLQKEGQERMDKIVDDVKDFVKEYAKTNGYTYILGSNEAGSVLYGDSKLDLTETILVAMNKKFKENGKIVEPEGNKETVVKENTEEEPPKK